jgi:hypothetical protein
MYSDYRTRAGTKREADLATLRATMATRPPRTQTREEQRRLSIRTLLIASVASAAAAVVTSQFWVHGTWIAAAMTPVIVSLVSEILHRPTEAVARRITTDRTAVLPPPEPGPEGEPGAELAPGQITVYGGRASRSGPPSRRKKFAVGLVVGTGLLGFAIAAVALTVPELITGQPIGNGNGGTTIFGGQKKTNDKQQTNPTQTQPQQTQTQRTTPTQTQPQQTQTQQTTPQQPKQQTAPAQPQAQGQQQQR